MKPSHFTVHEKKITAISKAFTKTIAQLKVKPNFTEIQMGFQQAYINLVMKHRQTQERVLYTKSKKSSKPSTKHTKS